MNMLRAKDARVIQPRDGWPRADASSAERPPSDGREAEALIRQLVAAGFATVVEE